MSETIEHFCPKCKIALHPFQDWTFSGGQISWCDNCLQYYIVTCLPTVRYAIVDADIGSWFTNISPLDKAGIGFSVSELLEIRSNWEKLWVIYQKRFETSSLTDIGKMMLAICLYRNAHPEIPENIRSICMKQTLRFLLNTDPSQYQIPINIDLPKESSYGKENPLLFVAEHKTLIVFSPNVGFLMKTNEIELLNRTLTALRAERDPQFIARFSEPPIVDDTFHRWNTLYSLINYSLLGSKNGWFVSEFNEWLRY